METEQPDIAVIRSTGRSFIRNDVRWVVREANTRGVPGSKGTASLIFDSREMTRRVWVFPRNWQELDTKELWAVSERSAMISTKFDLGSQDLSAALYASLIAINRARALLLRAEIASVENGALRAECRRLAGACRAERDLMRQAVSTHTNDLRTAGLTAEDASLYVASAVRESVARLEPTDEAATRLESDTCRWCTHAYEAA